MKKVITLALSTALLLSQTGCLLFTSSNLNNTAVLEETVTKQRVCQRSVSLNRPRAGQTLSAEIIVHDDGISLTSMGYGSICIGMYGAAAHVEHAEDMPIEGEMTFTYNKHCLGTTPAENLMVVFFPEDPETIGRTVILEDAVHDTIAQTFQLELQPEAGIYQIVDRYLWLLAEDRASEAAAYAYETTFLSEDYLFSFQIPEEIQYVPQLAVPESGDLISQYQTDSPLLLYVRHVESVSGFEMETLQTANAYTDVPGVEFSQERYTMPNGKRAEFMEIMCEQGTAPAYHLCMGFYELTETEYILIWYYFEDSERTPELLDLVRDSIHSFRMCY